jgi:putative heme-binding domain-containing protein
MQVPPGFRVEIVAAEPQIVNPLAMTFDDRGRIWITESIEYPRRPAGKGRDRIKILEDQDQDGRADTVTVFAGDLNVPSGIAIGFGGVWVVNAPDLLFFPLRDGADGADGAGGGAGEGEGGEREREVVVTGFGRTDIHELPNSLTWGPDGWLYGLNGVFNRSRVVSGGKELSFTCALFRVHPRTRAFEVVCEGTSNPWGLVWSPRGSAIVSACHWAKDHVFHFVESAYYQRQAGAYPEHAWPIGSVSDHGHQKTAYCGLAYLDSDAYPEEYRDRLYMGNVHGNCINADILERDGSTYTSRAAPDLLTADDAWFMPVSQKVGPDGYLYVLDWYDRYHCYQDANRDPAGVDRERGRLYRLRYGGDPRRSAGLDAAAADDSLLFSQLGDPNIHVRERAQRLLTERDTPAIRRELGEMLVAHSLGRKARIHALWALVGTGRLEPELHAALLVHPDPTFRAWGVRAAGEAGRVPDTVRERLAALATDAAAEVQLQVAIAARKVAGIDALRVLVQVLSACGEDRLVPAVVWPNLHPLIAERADDFARLVELADLERSPALAGILPRAIERVLAADPPHALAAGRLLTAAAGADPAVARASFAAAGARIPSLPEALVLRLSEPARAAVEKAAKGDPAVFFAAVVLGVRLGLFQAEGDAFFEKILSSGSKEADRLLALDTLVAARHPRLFEAVDLALASGSATLVAGVVKSLARLEDARVADILLARWADIPEEARPLVVGVLLERRHWARRLLDDVLAGKLPRDTLHVNHLRTILEGNDREAIWAVEKEWGQVRKTRSPEREDVVTTTLAELRGTPGDPLAGKAVFSKHCSRCHVIWGEGTTVGPDLTANGRASFEQLVASVLDPSLVIGPGYESTVIVTTDGRVLTGLVVEESASRVVLRREGGSSETIRRSELKYAKATELSLMPEGLESLLPGDDLRDLFAFLALDAPPDGERPVPIAGAPEWLGAWADRRASAPPEGEKGHGHPAGDPDRP